MNGSSADRTPEALDRIGLVLGAIYASSMGTLDLGAKSQILAQLGFSYRDIAAMLNSTERSVTVSIHTARKKAKRRSRKPKPQARRK